MDAGGSKPNILFVITDQHRPDHTGFGGNTVVQTPNLDGLAARGTRFDRAGGHYHQWLKRQGVDPEAIQGPKHQLQSVDVGWDQIYQPELPEELYPTTYVAERSIAFLEGCSADEPFFLQVSFPDPHHPF